MCQHSEHQNISLFYFFSRAAPLRGASIIGRGNAGQLGPDGTGRLRTNVAELFQPVGDSSQLLQRSDVLAPQHVPSSWWQQETSNQSSAVSVLINTRHWRAPGTSPVTASLELGLMAAFTLYVGAAAVGWQREVVKQG
ncbi:hypothetical protein DC522_14520 [Microvirga sp. KLBC 81]|nr:hypothetical protein DC522_14520 [Microvirga sp. KLBC 81]